jgi:non-heme Fe2+,alpha-ketoglutarate-dependent halogenase
MRLSPAAIARYREDGFLAPVDAFTLEEIGRYRAVLEEFEASLPAGPVAPRDQRKLHLRLPALRDLAEDPRLLDPVEQLIGPDILVFNATFFIKERGSDATAAWHQDATYFGLEPHEHVTAWVAFSDASEAAGCMAFLPGSHRFGQRRHAAQRVAGSVNAGSQAIAERLDERGAALAPLRAGQLSLHHTLVCHRSGPNRGSDRRIGWGISYIPTHVRHTGSYRMGATLVRGVDRFGHFALEPDPRELAEPARIAAHEAAYRRYREGYDEQIRRHAERYEAPVAEGVP